MIKNGTLLGKEQSEETEHISETPLEAESETQIEELNTKTEDLNNQSENLELESSESQTAKSQQFTPVQKPSRNKLHIFLILASIFLTILLVSFVSFTLINANSKTIISGVSIHNFDVSKMDKENALKLVKRNVLSNIPEEIKLTHGDFETSIPTADLNISFDISSAINEAYTIGRNGNLLQNDISILQTLFSNVQIEPSFTFDEDALRKQLEDISSKLPDRLIESSYYIENEQLILTKGRTGSVIDVDKTLASIKQKIKDLNLKNNIEIITSKHSPEPLDIDKIHSELYVEAKDASFTQDPYSVSPSENGIDFAISIDEVKNMLAEEKDEYEVPLTILVPNVTTNMLGREAFPDLLSSYSTNYSVRDRDRTTNLILAANKINGMVLMPGETFSYNKVVGERTISAGYREAPIYVSGEVVDGVGGGICQITTTLYNAVVYANLEIVERSNHQFVPSYARASRDATVVYGAIDFKFKNNRDYPIKLECSVANGTANFQVWGLHTADDYEVQITDRVTGSSANAIYSEAYKILKQNGQVVRTFLLSRDIYKRH